MPIILKRQSEIEMMRRSGFVAREIVLKMHQAIVAGVTTLELDNLARGEFQRYGAVALCQYYPTYEPGKGFPAYTCISVNEEVVHGIPGMRVLMNGDIVTLDLAVQLEGYCTDIAITVPVGSISPQKQRLLDVTKQTLDLALRNMVPGQRWSNVARLMQHNVEKHGYSVVREFVGHGIGRSMHEDPKIPNFVSAEQMRGDFVLKAGMTLAIEPMVVMGRRDVELLSDQWTVVTEDRLPAAHFEHTVAITDAGVDVLTMTAQDHLRSLA